MEKAKFLQIIIVILIILNIVVLAFMVMQRPPVPLRADRGRPPEADAFIINSLSLSKEQQEKFKALKLEYRKIGAPIDDSLKVLRDSLFDRILSADSGNTELLADRIGELEAHKVLATFNHFKQIAGLCSDEQKKQFSRMVREAIEIKGPPRPRGGQRNPPPPPPGAQNDQEGAPPSPPPGGPNDRDGNPPPPPPGEGNDRPSPGEAR